MKKITSVLAALLLVLSVLGQSNDLHILYKMKYDTENEEEKAMLELFGDANLEIYSSGTKIKSKLDMGFFMQLTTITDTKSGKVLILTDMMGTKIAVSTDNNEIESNNEAPVPIVTFEKGSKKIMGYKCKKATIINENGGLTTYWYTTKLKANKNKDQFFNIDLPGAVLEIITETEGMTMTFTASLVETKIKDFAETFSMEIPADFEKMSYQEFLNYGKE